jgi:hypothetical protein
MIRRISLSMLILLAASSVGLAQGGGRITGRVTSTGRGRDVRSKASVGLSSGSQQITVVAGQTTDAIADFDVLGQRAAKPGQDNTLGATELAALAAERQGRLPAEPRSNWLSPRGPDSFVLPSVVWVYVDGVRAGGVEVLHTVSAHWLPAQSSASSEGLTMGVTVVTAVASRH